MSKASFRQATRVLSTMARERWPSEIVDTFCNNWKLQCDLTIALHEGRVKPEEIQAFLSCYILPATEEPQQKGRILKPGQYVNRMVRAGYHTVARAPDGTVGMAASTYKKLWPKWVIQPPEYAGRFDAILCVDTSIPNDELVTRGDIYESEELSSCRDVVSAPTDDNGKFLLRYIAFVQLGEKNLRRSVEDCTKTFAEDEVGLVTCEGLHLPVQHKEYLRKYGVKLAGSRCESVTAPVVWWFGNEQPIVSVDGVQSIDDDYGFGSRGSKVVAVA